MINVNDTITAYDPADQVDVDVTVTEVGDIELVETVESEDGQRIYPDEQTYRRVYGVRLPDGTEWEAVAEWTGETNERNAHLCLAEG